MYSTVQYSTSWARTLWARSKFGLWYAAVGVVKMLHTDNKQQIRKLIQSPSKRRSYVTPGGLYHRPNLERAHKVLAQLVLCLLRSFFYDNNLTKLSSKAKELVSYWSDIFKFYMFQNVGYSKFFETPISNIDLYEVL